jgi:hypothetical protein
MKIFIEMLYTMYGGIIENEKNMNMDEKVVRVTTN